MKKIFIGIDVSKKTVDASVIIPSLTDDQPVVVAYDKFENRPSGFRKMVSMVRKQAQGIDTTEWLFCCETTGSYDIQLCDYMTDKKLDIWREHAAKIAKTRNDHGKDDRKDSLLIAEYSWRNRDKFKAYVPAGENIKNLKQLFLYRKQLVEIRKTLNVRTSEIEATISGTAVVSYINRDSKKLIAKISDDIKKCETKMRELIAADEELSRNFMHIMSVSGIGLVNAVALLVYTGNFHVIDSYKSFACYCGIVPFYKDSGTSVHQREYIGHKSNKTVRSYLSQAAQSAAQHNTDMAKYRDRMLAVGKPYCVVVNNIANKLLRIVFSLVENDCDYEQNHEFKRVERITFESPYTRSHIA